MGKPSEVPNFNFTRSISCAGDMRPTSSSAKVKNQSAPKVAPPAERGGHVSAIMATCPASRPIKTPLAARRVFPNPPPQPNRKVEFFLLAFPFAVA